MLSWYREKLQQFGFITATVLLFRVVSSKFAVDLANKFLPAKIECPCCGWSGRRFYSYFEVSFSEPEVVCPRCESHPRHRRYFLWLTKEYGLNDKQGLALVFAPERSLESLWQNSNGLKIVRADFETTRNVDVLLDLQRLPLADDAVDLIWCHHVLEHVENDGAAIKELNRTLRSGTGELVISVPMHDGSRTEEYGFPDPNNCGHWRTYGEDVADKLTSGGFKVQRVQYQLSNHELKKYRIDDDSPFYLCRKPAAANTRQ